MRTRISNAAWRGGQARAMLGGAWRAEWPTRPCIKLAPRDASRNTAISVESSDETGCVESNVASGHQAMESLLWGQSLNGTKAVARPRPASDYSLENRAHANCERRPTYLKAATDLGELDRWVWDNHVRRL